MSFFTKTYPYQGDAVRTTPLQCGITVPLGADLALSQVEVTEELGSDASWVSEHM